MPMDAPVEVVPTTNGTNVIIQTTNGEVQVSKVKGLDGVGLLVQRNGAPAGTILTSEQARALAAALAA